MKSLPYDVIIYTIIFMRIGQKLWIFINGELFSVYRFLFPRLYRQDETTVSLVDKGEKSHESRK